MGLGMGFEWDLCSVPLIVEDDSVKLTFRAAVFPHATNVLGRESGAWLVQIGQWVIVGDTSCSLLQADWGRRRRDTEVIYKGMGLSHKIGDFEFQDP